jgi:hypothetical protein
VLNDQIERMVDLVESVIELLDELCDPEANGCDGCDKDPDQ